MNNPMSHEPLPQVKQLAAMARREQPPTGHIAPQVLQRIRRRELPSLTRPLTVFAAIAAGTAVAVLLLIGVGFDSSGGDPLGAFFQVASITNI